MSTFQAVNTLNVPNPPPTHNGEETPTTPRPTSSFSIESNPDHDHVQLDEQSAKTPTRNTFGLAAQKPLPSSSPFTPPREFSATPSSRHGVKRESSHQSSRSVGSQDVEMGGGDDEGIASDDESVTDDPKQASKKKKAQRFYCTNFPPCHLSFTRSEHLARHIRSVETLPSFGPQFDADTFVENTQANDRSNATASDVSRALTTSDNMRKPSMSTKIFRELPWLPRVLVSRDKSGRIECDHQEIGPGRIPWAVPPVAIVGATVGISRPPA